MHQYATDVKRWRTIAGIGAVSLILTFIINPLIVQFLPETLASSGISLTVITLSGVIYYGYKYILWLPVGWFFDSQVPNINGEWTLIEDSAGILSSNSGDSDIQQRLVIDQNWMEMQADYSNNQGVYLQSDSGKISTSDANNPELILTCVGESPSPDGENYKKVDGTFRLRLVHTSDTEKLVGRYYSKSAAGGTSMIKFELKSRRLVRLRTIQNKQDKNSNKSRSAVE